MHKYFPYKYYSGVIVVTSQGHGLAIIVLVLFIGTTHGNICSLIVQKEEHRILTISIQNLLVVRVTMYESHYLIKHNFISNDFLHF